jgi:hypothetical protein
MGAAHSPVVAWGLYALELAMKAKAGRLARGEARGLLDRAKADLPEDAEAQVLALFFCGTVEDNPAQAGMVLHDGLTGWRDGMPLRRAQQARPVRYDWQDRADLNG